MCSFGLAASSACYTFDPQDEGPQATSTSSDEDPQAISTSSARGRRASTPFDTTHDERRLLRQAQCEDSLFGRHNAKTATSSSAQREDGRNSFGSPSAGFDPSSAHSARQLRSTWLRHTRSLSWSSFILQVDRDWPPSAHVPTAKVAQRSQSSARGEGGHRLVSTRRHAAAQRTRRPSATNAFGP